MDGIVNGDPLRDPGLSQKGDRGSAGAGQADRWNRGGSCVVVSPFPRALQTADALEGRGIPRVVDDELGDIRLGELEGATVARYRAAK